MIGCAVTQFRGSAVPGDRATGQLGNPIAAQPRNRETAQPWRVADV